VRSAEFVGIEPKSNFEKGYKYTAISINSEMRGERLTATFWTYWEMVAHRA